jgi:hypothetical protein
MQDLTNNEGLKGDSPLSTRKFRPLLLIALVIPAVFLHCIPYEYDSRWPDRVVTIDGSDGDWENAKVYVEKAGISFGVMNDSEFLYVCMASMNRRIAAQIMRRGLTVWLDPTGGQNQTFGIHFPLGLQGRDGAPDGTDREGFKTEFDPSGMMMGEGLTDLEMLGPGKKDIARMPVQEAVGIRVKAIIDSGRIVYELKVPLGRSDKTPYAVGTGSGKNVTIGLETPELSGGKGRGRAAWRGGSAAGGEMPQEGDSPEGEPGAGGGRGFGRGGGMGGHGMEPGGPGGSSMSQPFRFWVLVHLASRDASGKN